MVSVKKSRRYGKVTSELPDEPERKKGVFIKVGTWEWHPKGKTKFDERLYIGSADMHIDAVVEHVKRKVMALKEEVVE